MSETAAGSTATTYSYASGTHRLNAVGGSPLQSDAMGSANILTAPNGDQVGLDYDDRGLIDAVTNASATIGTYKYNGFNQRVLRSATVPSAIQGKYVYEPGGSSEPLGEYLSTGRREFIYLNNVPVAVAINASPVEVAQIQDLYTDQNGTIRSATDSQGNLIYSWQWSNNTFGTMASTGSANLFNRFPGQSYDAETGLFYNGSRYYDPAIGRYLQSDPLGMFGGQTSTYAYAGGDPFGNVDPFGLARITTVPADAIQYQSGNGALFYAPPKANWVAVNEAGYVNGPDPLGINVAVGHYGMYDFQRSNGDFYTQYTPAANYAVGAFMEGAGFSLNATTFIGNTFARLMSSNAGDPQQAYRWARGWIDAYNGTLARPVTGCNPR